MCQAAHRDPPLWRPGHQGAAEPTEHEGSRFSVRLCWALCANPQGVSTGDPRGLWVVVTGVSLLGVLVGGDGARGRVWIICSILL